MPDQITTSLLPGPNGSRGGNAEDRDPIWDDVQPDPHIDAVITKLTERWYGYIDVRLADGHDEDEIRRLVRVILEADHAVRQG